MPTDAELIDAAIRDGKFSQARRPHYERLMQADPVGTRQLLAQLTPVIPVGEVGAVTGPSPAAPVAAGPSDYPRDWLGPQDRPEHRQAGSRVMQAGD